jgi:hypothetical protein
VWVFFCFHGSADFLRVLAILGDGSIAVENSMGMNPPAGNLSEPHFIFADDLREVVT